MRAQAAALSPATVETNRDRQPFDGGSPDPAAPPPGLPSPLGGGGGAGSGGGVVSRRALTALALVAAGTAVFLAFDRDLPAGILASLLIVLCGLLLPSLTRTSTRLRRQVDQLNWLADHDETTGLLSRGGFSRRLEEALSTGEPRGALLLVDVDRFHEINETIGSEQGDLLLAQLGEHLETRFSSHPVARLGGDEFAILLDRARQAEIATATRTIFEEIAETMDVNGIRLDIALRVGTARYPEAGLDPGTLLRHASIALTAAKEEPGRVSLYSEQLERRDVAHLALVSDLRSALSDGRLVVHYQPQADVATGAIRGLEALVRWEHPERGLIVAGEFIPAIERTELISRVGRFVLREAVEEWRRLCNRGLTLDIAVNLSTVDLLDVTLPGTIVDLLIAQQMPAHRLVLEITETTLLRDEHRCDRVLRQLERLGVRLSIDDFGIGYSSLATLRKLPIRQVKLDRSFVAGIPADADNDTIVQSTIQLAHTLGARVVAEGVETAAQLHRLAALGCDTAQGYLIGRPMPPEALVLPIRMPISA